MPALREARARAAADRPSAAPLKPLLTARQLEAILQVREARVYEMARTGIFPPGVVVRMGRQVRFDEAALREWMRGGGSGRE